MECDNKNSKLSLKTVILRWINLSKAIHTTITNLNPCIPPLIQPTKERKATSAIQRNTTTACTHAHTHTYARTHTLAHARSRKQTYTQGIKCGFLIYPGASQSCQKQYPGQSLCGPWVSSHSRQFHSPRSAQTTTTRVVHSQSLPVFSHNRQFHSPRSAQTKTTRVVHSQSLPVFSHNRQFHSPRSAQTKTTHVVHSQSLPVFSHNRQFHSPRSAQTKTARAVHSQSLPVFSHNHSFTQPQIGTHRGSLSCLLLYGISMPCFSRPLDD